MENVENCPVCLKAISRDEGILKNSNSNHGWVELQCQHWFCCNCLKELYQRNHFDCPLCRGDIEELVRSHVELSSDEYSESENVEENESENEETTVAEENSTP